MSKEKIVWDDPNLFPDFGDKVPLKKETKEKNLEEDEEEGDDEEDSSNFDFEASAKGVSGKDDGFSDGDNGDGDGFSDDDNDDNDNDNDNDNDDNDDDDDDNYSSLAGALIDSGVITLDEGEKIPENLTQEQLIKLHQDEINRGLDQEFNNYMDSIGPDGVEFLKHTKDGGSASDFFETYSKIYNRPRLSDEPSEKEVTDLVTYYLKNERGIPVNEIPDQIDFLKSKEKLFSTAENFESVLNKKDEDEKKALKTTRENDLKNRNENFNNFKSNLSKSFDTDFLKSKLSKIDKNKITSMILDPIRKGDNKGSTEINVKIKELFEDENKDKLIIIAHLLNNDFDFKDLEKSIKSKVIKEEQKSIRQIKINKMSTGSKKNKKSTRFTDRL